MSTYFTINGFIDIPEQEAHAFEEEITPWLDVDGNDRFTNEGTIQSAQDLGDEDPEGARRYCFAGVYRTLGRFLPELVAEIQERTGRVKGRLFVVCTDGCWHAEVVDYEDGKTWVKRLPDRGQEAEVVRLDGVRILRATTEGESRKAEGDRASTPHEPS